MYIKNKEFEKSLSLVSDLINKDSLNYEYFLKKAEIFEYLEKYQECQIAFEKAQILSPKSAAVYNKMSFFHYKLNYFDNAIYECNVGLGLEKIDKDTKNYLLFTRAESLFMKKKYEEAIEDYKTILSNSPIESIESFCYLNAAKSFVKLNKNDDAIVYLENCLKKYPSLILAINNLAYRYSQKGLYSKSMELYEKALKLSLNLKLNEKGEVNFSEKLIGVEGSDKITVALILNNMGFIEYKLKKHEQALIKINKSLELFPENSFAHRNKALIYIDLNALDKACIEIEKSIELGFVNQFGDEILKLKKEHCK
ncbi:MAG: tetratricopeptide repeat protein [Bacteroidota bacterium]